MNDKTINRTLQTIDVIQLKEQVRNGYDQEKLKLLYYLTPHISNNTIEFTTNLADEHLFDELSLENYIEEASSRELLDSLQEISTDALDVLDELSSDFTNVFHQNIQAYLYKRKRTKKTLAYQNWAKRKFEVLVEFEYANLIQDTSLLAIRNNFHLELTY